MITNQMLSGWAANAITPHGWTVYWSSSDQRIIAARVFRQGHVRAYFINNPKTNTIEWEREQLYVCSWPRSCRVRTEPVQLRVVNDGGVAYDFMNMMVQTQMNQHLTNPTPYGPNRQHNGPHNMVNLRNMAARINAGQSI